MPHLHISPFAARIAIHVILVSLFDLGFFVSAANYPSSSCSCYKTSSGSEESIFRNYAFYDFRSIPPQVTDKDFDQPPRLVIASQDNGSEPVTAPYFSDTNFTAAWVIQSWKQKTSGQFPVELVNSAQNVYILNASPSSSSDHPSTHLTLRTSRLSSFQSAAQLCTTVTDLLYSSIRVSARISGDPGAVAGLFLYGNPNNETDTELLTRDPTTEIRVTNQPGEDASGKVIPGASSALGIPPGGSQEADAADSHSLGAIDGGSGYSETVNSSRGDWNVFRVDWRPGSTEWIVNNVSVANKSYGVPTVPCYFALNVWSNGGQWSGEMDVGGVATMDVEWVEMVYNVSGEAEVEAEVEEDQDRGQEGCDVVCEVDSGAAELGNPAVLTNAAGRVQLGFGGEKGGRGEGVGATLAIATWFLVVLWLLV